MEEVSEMLELFKILKKVRKQENFRMGMMSREEKIEYIVNQMNYIEDSFPGIVEYIDDNMIDIDNIK